MNCFLHLPDATFNNSSASRYCTATQHTRTHVLAKQGVCRPDSFKAKRGTMSYDEVEIEDMQWDEQLKAYTYPCPCGDLFQITLEELKSGEEIARCPSCSLYISVVYDPEDFADAEPPTDPGQTQPKEVLVC